MVVRQFTDDAIENQPIKGKPLGENLLDQSIPLGLLGEGGDLQAQSCGHLVDLVKVLVLHYVKRCPRWVFKQPVDADWLVVFVAGLSRKGFGAWVEVVFPP